MNPVSQPVTPAPEIASSTRPGALSISLRTAAFAVACERILSASRVRGLYP